MTLSLHLTPVNVIILLGAFQGLFLGGYLLLARGDERPGRYFLGFFALILAYNSLETFNWSADWNQDFFRHYVFTLIFGIGPSLYFYVRSFTRPPTVTLLTVWWHYLPLGTQFVIRSALTLHWFWGNNQSLTLRLANWHEVVSEPLSCLLACVYLWLARGELVQFRQRPPVEAEAAAEKALVVRWLGLFLVSMAALVVFWAFSLVAPHFIKTPAAFSFYYPTEVFLVGLVYWIGIAGQHRTRIIRVAVQRTNSTETLSETEIQRWVSALTAAMETDKLYLDAELTVGKLAARLNTSPKMVSAVLNQHLHRGFNEFVNEHRISEVKQQLLDPRNRHLTISGVALQCGFSSQATFQRVFKATVGVTPKQFIQSRTNAVSA